jgi:hypothetical protein
MSAPGLSRSRPQNLNMERVAVWVALALMAGTFALSVRSWIAFYQAPDGGNGDPVALFTQTDYPAITIASRLIVEGRSDELYELDAQREEQARLVDEGYLALPRDDELRYPYPYTPSIALLMSPFVGASPLIGMAIWDTLNVLVYAWGLWFLVGTLALSRVMRLLLLLGGLTSFPFIVNLEQGQSSGVVMLALGLGIGLLKRGRDLEAGLALGLLLLKIQWLPLLVLVLLWKGRWRAIAGMSATALVLVGLSIAVMGVGWIPDFLSILLEAQRGSRALLLDPMASHSLLGGLVALFGSGGEGWGRTLNLLVLLALAGWLLYLFRERWRPQEARWDGKIALLLLAAMLSNPHLNTHDLSLLALPAALGLAYVSNSTRIATWQRVWLGLAWAAYLIPAYLFTQAFSWPVRLTTWVIAAMLALLGVMLMRQADPIKEEPAYT